MIAPMLPHLAEEFYEASRGAQSSIFLETWQDMVRPKQAHRSETEYSRSLLRPMIGPW